jgi:hypothetical protein
MRFMLKFALILQIAHPAKSDTCQKALSLRVFSCGLGLRWCRRCYRLGDVIHIGRHSFDALEDGIAFAIVVIDVGDRNKII